MNGTEKYRDEQKKRVKWRDWWRDKKRKELWEGEREIMRGTYRNIERNGNKETNEGSVRKIKREKQKESHREKQWEETEI